jgi:hypothetical protein
MSDRSKVDRRSVAKAADALQERLAPAFEARNGRLHVGASWASDIRTRTKSLELNADVEWDTSRTYTHTHVEVARRPWFSSRWESVRSTSEAVDEMEARIAEWLRASST